MTDRAKELKNHMECLKYDVLQKIVSEYNSEYEVDAIEAAKAELFFRNRDILSVNDFNYVQIVDIISRVNIDVVLKVILELESDELDNIDSYKQVFNKLLQIKSIETSVILLSIEADDASDRNWDMFGVEEGEDVKFGIEFFPWSEWLAFRIQKDLVIKFGCENIVAYCLLKMTSNGFNETEIQQLALELGNVVLKDELDPIIIANNISSFENLNVKISEVRNILFEEKDVPQIRPFVRFWARAIDGIIISFLLNIILKYVFNSAYNLNFFPFHYIDILLFFWIFIEALLLSTWGTTPGKFILNIYVRETNGEKLTYKRALYRSFFVWFCGNGFGIMYVGFIANVISYFLLTQKGETLWDGKGNFNVMHRKVGIFRSLIAIIGVIFLLLILINVQKS